MNDKRREADKELEEPNKLLQRENKELKERKREQSQRKPSNPPKAKNKKNSLTKKPLPIDKLKEKRNWKEWYDRMLLTPQWQKVREKVLQRDKHQCCLCGSDFNLQVHHTYYKDELTPPWAYPRSSLVTLCENCHLKVHNDETHQLNPKNHKTAPN